ncbi:hypothetical protein EYF80_036728 [Liparis tanakae]|uniref:Uncharacterized protein n=1 Tax=Liparis tanakae TaxID=230148 RepID=A0A4Z2GIH8_9TELE|nr:hypothetical protein EYF80_036728 [Liparis tanakae]
MPMQFSAAMQLSKNWQHRFLRSVMRSMSDACTMSWMVSSFRLLSIDHQQRIVETLLLPEGAKDLQEFLGMLWVRNPGTGFTRDREGHVEVSLHNVNMRDTLQFGLT